jgi:hypothetical protein
MSELLSVSVFSIRRWDLVSQVRSVLACSTITAFVVLLGGCGHEQIEVEKEPAMISKQTLDNVYYPQGNKCGRAYTYWCFMCTPEFRGNTEVTKSKDGKWLCKFCPTSAKVVLSLPLTVWVPFGVSDKLMLHEYGHCKMCKTVYENADQIARQLAQDILNAKFVGGGDTRDDASFDAVKNAGDEFSQRYTKKTQLVADEVATIYDRITNHGMNDVPEETAIKQGFDEYYALKQRKKEESGHEGSEVRQDAGLTSS